jgi:hypothetical protein
VRLRLVQNSAPGREDQRCSGSYKQVPPTNGTDQVAAAEIEVQRRALHGVVSVKRGVEHVPDQCQEVVLLSKSTTTCPLRLARSPS